MAMPEEKLMPVGVQYSAPMNIATISAGFEKGDFLVREEQGNRVYFDFFEEVCSRNSKQQHYCTKRRMKHFVKSLWRLLLAVGASDRLLIIKSSLQSTIQADVFF
jgi:hypothetical protein